MAVIFLLGPSLWRPDKGAPSDPTPMQARREIAEILRGDGHHVLLMEDEPDREGEDLIQKFDRLLSQHLTDIIVYWPPLAKMQTTYDELILLYDRRSFLEQRQIRIWVVHHVSVASIHRDAFLVLEPGQRSRYLTAIARLGVHPLEWENERDLRKRIRLLSMELLQ